MIVYIILVLLILFLPITRISKKKYCILIGVFCTFVVGLRNINMGMGDTKDIYLNIFNKISNMSYANTFNFIKRQDVEIVFYMLMRLYATFTKEPRLFLIICTIPYMYAISRLIYKYSKAPYFSFIMFFSLNYFAFSFTLIRHCIALAFLIFAYDGLVERNFRKFLVFVIIATAFHRTAFIFIIAYPLLKVKCGLKNIILVFCSLIISIIFRNTLLNRLIILIGSKHFLQYLDAQANTLVFFFMNFLILLYVFFIAYKYYKNNSLLINVFTIGICFASCMFFFSEAFRICTFFSIYSIIILPNAIKEIEDFNIRILSIYGLLILFIVYFFLFTMYNNEIYPYILMK